MFEDQKRYFKRIYKLMSKRQKKLWTLLKFLVIFNILAIPLHLIIYFNFSVYPLALLERSQVSFFLDVFGLKHALYDVPFSNGFIPAININEQVLAIGEPCTSIRSLLAFTALVVASPRKSWVSKKRALVYLPVIYAFNILRIVTLAFVSFRMPDFFDVVHIFLWREGMIALILLLWIYWFKQEEPVVMEHDVTA